MNVLMVLKKDDLALARDEACALCPGRFEKINNLLLMDCEDISSLKRLSQARRLVKILSRFSASDIDTAIDSIDWKREVVSPFCVRGSYEKKIASSVWKSLSAPSVDLRDPKTTIEVLKAEDDIIIGIQMYVFGSSEERRAHKRPFLHPSSLDPSLARCMVNLTGVKEGVIEDPFCGSGGILIEAALMGIGVRGSDIDPGMVKGCRENLLHYDLVGRIMELDALNIKKELPFVVTDLPYLLNTKGKKLDRDVLYKKIFGMLDHCVSCCCVIGMPSDAKTPETVNLRKKAEYIIPIHRSLSKKVIVLEKVINSGYS